MLIKVNYSKHNNMTYKEQEEIVNNLIKQKIDAKKEYLFYYQLFKSIDKELIKNRVKLIRMCNKKDNIKTIQKCNRDYLATGGRLNNERDKEIIKLRDEGYSFTLISSMLKKLHSNNLENGYWDITTTRVNVLYKKAMERIEKGISN